MSKKLIQDYDTTTGKVELYEVLIPSYMVITADGTRHYFDDYGEADKFAHKQAYGFDIYD